MGLFTAIVLVGCSDNSARQSDPVADSSGGAPSVAQSVGEVGSAALPPASLAQCKACHSVSADGGNGVGPRLFGVVGRQAGTEPGYSYSEVLANSGLTWTPEKLDKFIEAPSQAAPGNKMSYIGLKDPDARKLLVEYLASLKN